MEENLNNPSIGLDKQEITLLKERFITKYCKERGWNPDNLTTEQYLEISQKREFKNPGLILG